MRETVNFATKEISNNLEILTVRSIFWIFVVSGVVGLAGCGDGVVLPTDQQLAIFLKAGPITSEMDVDRLLSPPLKLSEYQITIGDILEIRIPRNLLFTSAQDTSVSLDLSGAILVRIDEEGTITLPVVGRLPVQNKTITQVEADIVNAYYPKYSIQRPTIIAKVSERKTAKVTITGAVKKPGIYELPSDKMTLVSAIMAAEGIVDKGAGVIRVSRPGMLNPIPSLPVGAESQQPISEGLSSKEIELSFHPIPNTLLGTVMIKYQGLLLYAEDLDVTDPKERSLVCDRIQKSHPEVPIDQVNQQMCGLAEVLRSGSGNLQNTPPPVAEPENTLLGQSQGSYITDKTLLVMPVKGMNVPFSDIALTEGATVEVETLDEQVFTVMGLVKVPGVFPYPANSRYNLLQAISFAGGVDKIANPRYVRVYRQTQDGKIVDAAFSMKDSIPTSAAALLLKPGDVVAVEETPRTHMNTMLAEIFAFRLGSMVGANYDYRYFAGKDVTTDQ